MLARQQQGEQAVSGVGVVLLNTLLSLFWSAHCHFLGHKIMLFYELSTRCHLVLHWVMALERRVCHLQAFNFQSAGLLFWRGVLYFEPRSFLNLAKYFLVSKPNQQVTAKEQIDWKWKKSARENQSASHKCPNGMRAAVSWMIHLWHNSSTPTPPMQVL